MDQSKRARYIMILPSLLGPFQGMMADSSPTARFDEHRHPKNAIGLVCALGEQGRRTATILPSPFYLVGTVLPSNAVLNGPPAETA